MIQSEVLKCQSIAETYPKNYYAWTYRSILCNRLCSLEDVQNQLESLAQWQRRHVSDHSACQHRQHLWKLFLGFISPDLESAYRQVIKNPRNKSLSMLGSVSLDHSQLHLLTAFWDNEFALANRLMEFYPGHESLWYHRRLLVSSRLIVALIASLPGADSVHFQTEFSFIQTAREDDAVSYFEKNRRFASSYHCWLLSLVRLLSLSTHSHIFSDTIYRS